MKKTFYLIGLASVMLFTLYSCGTVGYVASIPTHSERFRPAQPTTAHVWIDGDWEYNRSSRSYHERDGYWERPRENRVYVAGYWQTSPQGNYWVKGKYRNN